MEQELDVGLDDATGNLPTGEGTDVTLTEGGGETKEKSKRHRKRKRALYANICTQMEFYFSDANITKNRLMLDMITSMGCIPLENFLEFNRMKALTTNVEDIRRALVTSEKLKLSSDGKGVSRKVAFDPDKTKSEAEVEECTVYVENIPRHVDHAWLEKVFVSFGPIAYISLPKFKISRQPKGFAFIEFERKESAQGCVEAYIGEGAVLPPNMDPAQLMSVQTFKEEQEINRKLAHTLQDKVSPSSTISKSGESPGTGTTKRKMEDPICDEASKRRKGTDQSATPLSESGTIDTETLTNATISVSNTPVTESFISRNDENYTELDVGEKTGKKKKRKRNKMAKTSEEKLEGDSIHLKVMSKKNWRQLRNRYLNLQRQYMSKLKKQLQDYNLRTHHYKNCLPEPKNNPGNIVEIFLDTPAESEAAFKAQVQLDLSGQTEEEAVISQFVKYVDYEAGGRHAYVRFCEDECFTDRIKTFVHNAEKVFKGARILSVKEVQDYKAKVQERLKNKVRPRKKERGKDRLLKAAAKSSQHIRFDELDKEGLIADMKEEEEPAIT